MTSGFDRAPERLRDSETGRHRAAHSRGWPLGDRAEPGAPAHDGLACVEVHAHDGAPLISLIARLYSQRFAAPSARTGPSRTACTGARSDLEGLESLPGSQSDLNIAPLKGLVFPLLLVVLTAPNGYADQCRDILQAGLFDQTTSQSDRAATSAARSWACSATLSEAQDYLNKSSDRSAGGGGSVNYVLFSAGGSASQRSGSSLTSDELRRWKSENCEDVNVNESSKAFEFFAQTAVSTGVVSAWRECMLGRRNLSCWAEPHGEEVALKYSWSGGFEDLPVVRRATFRKGGESGGAERLERHFLNPGEQVFQGEASHFFSRHPNEDLRVQLTVVTDQRFSYDCYVFVPREDLLSTALPQNEDFGHVSERLSLSLSRSQAMAVRDAVLKMDR